MADSANYHHEASVSSSASPGNQAMPSNPNGSVNQANSSAELQRSVDGELNGAAEAYPEDGDELGVPVEVDHAAQKKKKKSKSRPASKRGLNAPNGFEQFFADAPLTPEQYAEDKETYDSDLPFINRILAAIQRFERARKMSPERRHIFHNYLAYGGVEVSPNMFQSAADLDQKSMTKDELATALSQVHIGSDKHDTSSPNALYAVDFVGCMRAYLSRHASSHYGFETFENVLLVTTTLERFMDYLLQHDVCPEYKSEVLKTRELCRAAASELWGCSQAYQWLPGDFNIACSTLFGGSYGRNYDGAVDWETDTTQTKFVGMTDEVATQVVKMGIAGAATESVYQKYVSILNCNDGSNRFDVVSRIPDTGFTITKIFQPTKECIKLYKTQSADFRPLGRIVAVPWTNPDKPPEDLTAEEREIPGFSLFSQVDDFRSSVKLTEVRQEEYSFLIETPLITHLRVGMHIEATIHRLNFGIDWFDDFRVVYPSFDNWLYNDLMVGWKTSRWLKGSVEYELEEERKLMEEEERAKGDAYNGHDKDGLGTTEQEVVHDDSQTSKVDDDAEHVL